MIPRREAYQVHPTAAADVPTVHKYDLDYALKPLINLQNLFAVNRSRVQLSPLQKTRRFLYTLFTVSIAVLVIYYRRVLVYNKMQFVLIVSDLVDLMILCWANIANIFISAFHSTKAYKRYHERLHDLIKRMKITEDDMWIRERKMTQRLLIISLVPLFIICGFDMIFRIIKVNYIIAALYLIDYIFVLANVLISLHFILSLMIVKHVFLIINMKIVTIYDSRFARDRRSELIEENRTAFIQNLLYAHDSYMRDALISIQKRPYDLEEMLDCFLIGCQLCDDLNTFFQEQNLLATLSCITTLIRALYSITSATFIDNDSEPDSVNFVSKVAICLFALHHIAILFGVTSACELVSAEVHKTTRIVDALLYRSHQDDRDKLYLWSNLISRRTPIFTACNCFTLNFSLLFQIGGTVVTYLVILIQLKNY